MHLSDFFSYQQKHFAFKGVIHFDQAREIDNLGILNSTDLRC